MSEDTKLKELIINTLSPEQFEYITPSETEIYLVEDDAEYATVEELATKQDKLTTGNGIDIINNKISTNSQFNITEDMFDIEYDDTKGVDPYSTSYGYTNITIHEDASVEWVDGAIYTFVLDTKVSKSANRNVRLRIGKDGDWKPLMGLSSTIASGATFFIKARAIPFQYKSTYITDGALHTMYYDTDTTYTINYLYDAGRYHAGTGTYAITRYSFVLQKPDGTWEKCTATNSSYSTATTKEVNTNGFILNQIKYYRYTSAYANGALVAANYLCPQYNELNGAYSFNCGTAPGWAVGDYIYLVGTIGADGLFYLDTTQWWSNSLPITNDGKIYIQLGSALTTTDATMTFLNDRPIFYHDGTSIKQYIVHDNTKQDVINDLSAIRNNAQTGANLAPQVAVNTQRIEDLTTSRIPDVIYRGTPKITGGQITNFSTINYLLFPFEDISRGLPFDIYFSFTTDSDITTQQNIIDSKFGIALAIQNGKGVMALSSNGINWDIGSVTGTVTLLPNTTYYVKYSWTGTEYKTYISTNSTFDTTDMVLPSTLSPFKTTIYIGGCDQQATTHTPHPFKGIINFTKSRVDVNRITVWEGMADVGIASRANVSLTNLDEVGEKRFADKQDKLTEGANISIVDNTISVTGDLGAKVTFRKWGV